MAYKFNTGNPVGPNGSADARDLVDNSQVADRLINGTELAAPDRLGVARKTWAGMENQFEGAQSARESEFNAFLASSGFETPAIVYTDGVPLQVDRPTQLLERASDPGTLYSIKLPSAFPVILTGTWATDEALLVVRTDQALRQDIADPDKGAAMVARGVVAVDSIADLLALPEGQRKEGLRYLVLSYHQPADSSAKVYGGGQFKYDPSRVSENDGGTVLDGFVREVSGPIDVACFGAVGDDDTDDTLAFKRAFAYIQNNGGGELDLADRTYKIACEIGEILLSLSGVRGFRLISNGAKIRDTTEYSKVPAVQIAKLMQFDYCDGVQIWPWLNIESTVPYDGVSPGSMSEGVQAITFGRGCRNIEVNMTGYNIGRRAICIEGAAGDSGADRTTGIKVRAKIHNSRYGFLAQWNGDSADVELETYNVGRPFFLYGVDDCKIKVRGRNSGTSLIKSYGVGIVGTPEAIGYGCSNIEVWFSEKGGDTYRPGALIAIHFGDGRPATMRNIKLHMDTVEPQGSAWGDTLEVCKYGPGDTTPDSIGRGHVLDGLEVTGYMSKREAAHMTMTKGGFAAPDVVRGVHFHDLILEGNRSFHAPATGVTSVVKFTNVISGGNIYSQAPGGSVFIACEAASFTSSTVDNTEHDYISCKITNGGLQNYDQNKSFINTETPLGLLNSVLGRAQSTKATTVLRGDLTTGVSVFRLPPGTQGLLRIRYHLTFATGVIDPGSRREVAGIKTLTLTVNSSGIPVIQIPIGDELPERVLGANPAVVAFGVVAGDATNGAYVTFIATEYNQSTSRALLEVELLGDAGYLPRVYPV